MKNFIKKIEDHYQVVSGLFMNESEIDDAVRKYRDHPVLGKATQLLSKFRDLINSNSDGWPYWKAGSAAARQLMTMIGSPDTATEAQLKKAMVPIKSLCTRHKLKFPE